MDSVILLNVSFRSVQSQAIIGACTVSVRVPPTWSGELISNSVHRAIDQAIVEFKKTGGYLAEIVAEVTASTVIPVHPNR